MIRWTPSAIAETLDMRTVARADDHPIAGIATDTREPMLGALFVALRGDRFDAHDYLHAAIEQGASSLLVDREEVIADDMPVDVILAEDTTAALADLARAYRATLRGSVIAITGSNGKTTTVRLLDAALRGTRSGSASKKSLNNHLGVPLTILAASERDDYLVAEVGMNAPGEIAPLAELLRPDIAIITSIGDAHIKAFGQRDGIAREKGMLLDHLTPDGLAILNADSPELRALFEHEPRARWFGTGEDAETRVVRTDVGADGTAFALNDASAWRIPLQGAHHALNATSAILAARAFGVSDADIRVGLLKTEAPPMRFEHVEAAGVRFTNDAYNASPDSVRAALDTFAALITNTPTRRVIILGDMLEQGDHAPNAHRDAIEHALSIAPDLLILIGPAFAEACTGNTPIVLPEPSDETISSCASLLRRGDRVLLKGSRGMRLERIIASVRSCEQNDP